MNKADTFFQNLEMAIGKTNIDGLNCPFALKFEDCPPEKNKKIIYELNKYYEKIIAYRDHVGIDRYRTIMDCSNMSPLYT
jgi:hypothetical protein